MVISMTLTETLLFILCVVLIFHVSYDAYFTFTKRKWGVFMSITQIIIISLGAIVCVGYIIYSVFKFKKDGGSKKW